MKYVLFFIVVAALTSCNNIEVEYYPNGSVKSEITYRNDKKNGVATYYYNNGQINVECSYKNDSLDGQYKKMNADRSLNEVTEYKNGKKHGLSILYSEFNKISVKMNFENDFPHGDYSEFFDNGQIRVKGQYDHGQYDGHWDYYDFNGVKVGVSDFVSGDGTQTAFYYSSDQPRTIIDFTDNKKVSEIHLSREGDTVRIIKFSDGKIQEVK